MAEPTPSVILSSVLNRMNTQPDGMEATKLWEISDETSIDIKACIIVACNHIPANS